MLGPPPPGYVDLKTAFETRDKAIDVMGIVAEYFDPSPTKGTDWQLTFKIQDPLFSETYSSMTGIRVKFFKPEHLLPKVRGKGDVVILRRIKFKNYQESPVLMSGFTTECVVIPANAIPESSYKVAYAGGKEMNYLTTTGRRLLTAAEQMYAIALKQELNHILGSGGAIVKTSRPISTTGSFRTSMGHKFSLIKDVQIQKFYDLVGQVVKMHQSMDFLELYITDYTTNALLYDHLSPEDQVKLGVEGVDGDPFGHIANQDQQKWPGPYGRMTLRIELQAPHSYWANNNVKVNDFVLLQNVRIKMSSLSKLEANIWQDRLEPDRIQVRILKVSSQPEVEAILKRKEAYWERRPKAVDDEVQDETSNAAKKRKKKNKKQQQKQAQAEKETRTPQKKTAGLVIANQHVQCSNGDIHTTPISEIINNPFLMNKTPSGVERQLPFINMKCRARVRVVDFYPDTLEDFSRSLDDPTYNDTASDDEDPIGLDSQGPRGWEWNFFLRVEDAKPPPGTKATQMTLLVVAEDAEFLLKLDATDLRKDPKTLANLREKLFIVWGDLEERKTAAAAQPPRDTSRDDDEPPEIAASSVAFDCCIKEYGVKLGEENVKTDSKDLNGGWMRMHRMYGTTIM
ncbi:hypothetical protein BJ546DRAFT_836434 [Cryomyces antarcticus]